ncbi:MAG: PrsW family intramembrane metalloprotease [Kineosporiaceae bacterium]
MSELPSYRPSVPAGLPPERALPTPARPRLRAVLAWAAVVIVTGGCALLSVAAITRVTGVPGLVTGTALAAIPVVPVVAAFLWLDRFEAEPASLLAFAFVWGAGVASFGALVVNTASLEAIRQAGGDATTTVLVVAPVTEEALKGVAVLLVLLLRRREFDGVVDGLVYAGLVGVGFAFVENVLYLGRGFATGGGASLVTVFVVRCVVSPFAHPLFTGATGVGLGVAARSRRPLVRVVAPLAGFVVAVVLHSAWNLSALSGLSGFLWLYVVVQLPIFLCFVALAVLAHRREGRLIAGHPAVYARTGWLTRAEVAMLASLTARRDARDWAERVGGAAGRSAMRDFQDFGSELAFLRQRMIRGTAAPDAPTQELALLAALSDRRAAFLPSPGVPAAPPVRP